MKHLNNIEFNVQSKSNNSLVNGMMKETSYGKTENGADTFTRSGSQLLDFYAQAGAMRNSKKEALELFKKAFAEDNEKAVRILFYLRDVRGGQGERDLFRICLECFAHFIPKTTVCRRNNHHTYFWLELFDSMIFSNRFTTP